MAISNPLRRYNYSSFYRTQVEKLQKLLKKVSWERGYNYMIFNRVCTSADVWAVIHVHIIIYTCTITFSAAATCTYMYIVLTSEFGWSKQRKIQQHRTQSVTQSMYTNLFQNYQHFQSYMYMYECMKSQVLCNSEVLLTCIIIPFLSIGLSAKVQIKPQIY